LIDATNPTLAYLKITRTATMSENIYLRGVTPDNSKHQRISLKVTVCGTEKVELVNATATQIIMNELTSVTGHYKVDQSAISSYFQIKDLTGTSTFCNARAYPGLYDL
jgi:hypothetical protein